MDAQEAEFPSTRFPRIEPRQPLVWVRVAGRWREGRITKWVHDREHGHWVIWTSYEDRRPSSARAWFVYDPRTVRPRSDGDQPPQD